MVGLEYNLHQVELQSGDGEGGIFFVCLFVCLFASCMTRALWSYYVSSWMLLRNQNYLRCTIL